MGSGSCARSTVARCAFVILALTEGVQTALTVRLLHPTFRK